MNYFTDSQANVFVVELKRMLPLSYMQPFQFGIALPKDVSGPGFVCIKVDMKNAFNLVSRRAVPP